MLRFLLNVWLLPIFGMMLAAGAIADPGIGSDPGGGGDPGGDLGSDPGADPGAVDPDDPGSGGDPNDADPNIDPNADPDDPNAPNSDPNAPALVDGRQVSAEDKKLIDLAQKAGPKALKRQKQLIYAEQRLLKAIPGGTNGAIQLAKDIEALGGIEGVQQLQTDMEELRGDADLFAKGDPSWVESGFQQNPDSALKLFTHSLDYVGEHHPEHYDHLMAKVIVNDLGALDIRGIHGALAAMKDNPEAQRLAKQLADYYNGRLETSKKVPEKKVDAQSKALSAREAEVSKKEMGVREAQARTEIKPALQARIGSSIRAEAQARGLDLAKLAKDYKGEYVDLVSKIHDRVNKLTMKDGRFLRNFHAHLTKGDIQKAVKLADAKHAEVIGEAVRMMFEGSGIFRGKKTNTPNADKGDKNNRGDNNANANQGWTRVPKKPEQSAINYSKTTTAMALDGKYILNDGRKVVVSY